MELGLVPMDVDEGLKMLEGALRSGRQAKNGLC